MAKRGPDRVERIHQAIARELGTAILTGRYAPGQSLDGEIEQAATLGVSRTAYREAVRMLVAKGLIHSRPKAGTRVTEKARWNILDPDILAWMFSGKPDIAFVRDLFELRGVLEPAAARMAAARRTAEQLARMSDALAVMGSLGLGQVEGQEADRQFHRLILEATGNEVIASLGESIGAAVRWTTHFKQQAKATPRDPLAEHEAVYQAISDRDEAAAASEMHGLLRLAFEDMALA